MKDETKAVPSSSSGGGGFGGGGFGGGFSSASNPSRSETDERKWAFRDNGDGNGVDDDDDNDEGKRKRGGRKPPAAVVKREEKAKGGGGGFSLKPNSGVIEYRVVPRYWVIVRKGMALEKYQEETVDWAWDLFLHHRDRCAGAQVGLDMGLGKTFVSMFIVSRIAVHLDAYTRGLGARDAKSHIRAEGESDLGGDRIREEGKQRAFSDLLLTDSPHDPSRLHLPRDPEIRLYNTDDGRKVSPLSLFIVPGSIKAQCYAEFHKFLGPRMRVLLYHQDDMPKTVFDTIRYSDIAERYDIVLTTPDVISLRGGRLKVFQAQLPENKDDQKTTIYGPSLDPEWYRDVDDYTGPHFLFRTLWLCIVTDEIEIVTNYMSRRFKTFVALSGLFSMGLSGTMYRNDAKDIYAEFRATAGYHKRHSPAGWCHDVYLHDGLEEHVKNLTQEQAGLVLPKCHRIVRTVRLNEEEKKLYRLIGEIRRANNERGGSPEEKKERKRHMFPLFGAQRSMTQAANMLLFSLNGEEAALKAAGDEDADELRTPLDEDEGEKKRGTTGRGRRAAPKRGGRGRGRGRKAKDAEVGEEEEADDGLSITRKGEIDDEKAESSGTGPENDPLGKHIHLQEHMDRYKEMRPWIMDAKGTAGIHSSKMRVLRDAVSKVPGSDKAIIFSCWDRALVLIEAMMVEEGYSVIRYSSKATNKARDGVIDSFIHDPNIQFLLITYGCGARGFNLIIANWLFRFDGWWTANAGNQAIARVKRYGQKKEVYDVNIVCPNTLDQVVAEAAYSKLVSGDAWMNLKKANKSAEHSILMHGCDGGDADDMLDDVEENEHIILDEKPDEKRDSASGSSSSSSSSSSVSLRRAESGAKKPSTGKKSSSSASGPFGSPGFGRGALPSPSGGRGAKRSSAVGVGVIRSSAVRGGGGGGGGGGFEVLPGLPRPNMELLFSGPSSPSYPPSRLPSPPPTAPRPVVSHPVLPSVSQPSVLPSVSPVPAEPASAVPEGSECVACMVNPRDCLLFPCKYVCLAIYQKKLISSLIAVVCI